MDMQIKYYKVDDPITGVETKLYGWTCNVKVVETRVRILEDEFVVEKFNVVETERCCIPKGKNVIEITEEEFNNLDTKGESLLSQLHREKQFLRIKSLVSKPKKPEIESAEVLVEHLEKMM